MTRCFKLELQAPVHVQTYLLECSGLQLLAPETKIAEFANSVNPDEAARPVSLAVLNSRY